MIDCVIFDCDGTLVDSEHLGNQVLSEHFNRHGVPVSAEELVQEFRGGHFARMVETLENRFKVQVPDSFIPEYRLLVDAVFEQQLRPLPGATEMLSALTVAKCVASNAPIKKTRRSLQLTKLSHHFGDALYSAYDVNAWKPDPELFLHAASDMGFDRQQCLVVEDSEAGMLAGVAAGMRTVLLDPTGAQAAPKEVTVIRSLEQLHTVMV